MHQNPQALNYSELYWFHQAVGHAKQQWTAQQQAMHEVLQELTQDRLHAFASAEEWLYLFLSVAVTVGFYAVSSQVHGLSLLLAALSLPLVLGALLFQAFGLGHIQAHGIRVTAAQCPTLYGLARQLAGQLKLKAVPDIYLVDKGQKAYYRLHQLGKRQTLVLSTYLLERLLEKAPELPPGQAPEAMQFLLYREWVLLKRGQHDWLRMMLWPARLMLFLTPAYARASEKVADTLATHLYPKGAVDCLLLLKTSGRLKDTIDLHSLYLDAQKVHSVWHWLAQMTSGRLTLRLRLRHVLDELLKTVPTRA